jgi:hypothetical protein
LSRSGQDQTADGGKPPVRRRHKTDSGDFCRAMGPKRAPLTRRHTASAFHTAWARPTSPSVWSVSTPGARRGQVVRPKLATRYGPFSWTTRFTLQESLRKGWLFDRPAPMLSSPPSAVTRGHEGHGLFEHRHSTGRSRARVRRAFTRLSPAQMPLKSSRSHPYAGTRPR